MGEKLKEIIDKKKKEVMSDLQRELESAMFRAGERIKSFADSLQEACTEPSPSNLLEIIDNDGVGHREVFDIEQSYHSSQMNAGEIIRYISDGRGKWRNRSDIFNGKVRVTIIMEPVEEEGKQP